jgi:hypothetical protein
MIRLRKSTARLAVEALEDRSVPAGNVMAQVVDGTLVVVGDDLDNYLMVHVGETTRLFGVDTTVNGQPTFNGQTHEPVVFTGVERVEIQTGGGDDTVVSFGGGVPLTVATGDGADLVYVEMTERAQVSISTGAGADAVKLYIGGYREGDFDVDTGDGADTVDVFIDALKGSLSIETGNGNDAVWLSMAHDASYRPYFPVITGGVTISTGNGNDRVHSRTFATGPGEFEPIFPGDFRGDGALIIDTGRGKDTVDVAAAGYGNEDCDVVIRTGEQNDDVYLLVFSNFGGDVFVDTGDGQDAVFLYGWGTMTGNLSMNTGAGNDLVVFSDDRFTSNLQITGDVTLDGGDGPSDELVFLGDFGLDAFLGGLSIAGFEIIEF